MLLVDLLEIQLDPGAGAALVVLREHEAPNRLLPIAIDNEDAIDAEVDEFRDFLAELDPADFIIELQASTGPAVNGSGDPDGDTSEG
jgi:hypothetical protein